MLLHLRHTGTWSLHSARRCCDGTYRLCWARLRWCCHRCRARLTRCCHRCRAWLSAHARSIKQDSIFAHLAVWKRSSESHRVKRARPAEWRAWLCVAPLMRHNLCGLGRLLLRVASAKGPTARLSGRCTSGIRHEAFNCQVAWHLCSRRQSRSLVRQLAAQSLNAFLTRLSTTAAHVCLCHVSLIFIAS